jgi:hypothetical protein
MEEDAPEEADETENEPVVKAKTKCHQSLCFDTIDFEKKHQIVGGLSSVSPGYLEWGMVPGYQ